MAWWKLGALLIAAGLLVGTLVAAVSVGTAAPLCPGRGGAECRDLVVTLARRSGLVAGFAVVFMTFLAAGLMRTLAQDDRDRATEAMEAYRASRRATVGEK